MTDFEKEVRGTLRGLEACILSSNDIEHFFEDKQLTIDEALLAIQAAVRKVLPEKKKNIWYQASGQDFYSSDDAYKDGECNGGNAIIDLMRSRLKGER